MLFQYDETVEYKTVNAHKTPEYIVLKSIGEKNLLRADSNEYQHNNQCETVMQNATKI